MALRIECQPGPSPERHAAQSTPAGRATGTPELTGITGDRRELIRAKLHAIRNTG